MSSVARRSLFDISTCLLAFEAVFHCSLSAENWHVVRWEIVQTKQDQTSL